MHAVTWNSYTPTFVKWREDPAVQRSFQFRIIPNWNESGILEKAHWIDSMSRHEHNTSTYVLTQQAG